MKVVLSTSYILLCAGLVGGVAHAKGLVKIQAASSIECSTRNVEIASEDVQMDKKKAKVLTVRNRSRILASVMNANAERIDFLNEQCHDAVRVGRRVAINVLTGEVTPKGGFSLKDQIKQSPATAAKGVSLSLHVIPRKLKSPNDF